MTRACVLAFAALVSCGNCPKPAAPARPAREAMVVGTMHTGHLLVREYPMTKLDALLSAFAPDLVLVEIRPEPFARGEYEDGPLEMSYVTLAAKSRGIAVEAIDWFRDEDFGHDPPGDPEGERIFERNFAELAKKTDSYDTFEALNSREHGAAFLRIENARARYGVAGGISWHRRQSWMHFEADIAIARHGPKRVAAFVGFAHRPELAEHFTTEGMASVDPLSVATPAIPMTVPNDVVAFWRDAIPRLRAKQATLNEAGQRTLGRKIRVWEAAVATRGACCIDEKTLE